MSPPCIAFGPWSNFNCLYNQETWLEFLIGKPLAIFCARVAMAQMSEARHFICENPWSSHLWQLPVWESILKDPRVRTAYADQCQFGLMSLDKVLHKKPTAFVASHELLVDSLCRECDGKHEHEVIAGSSHGVPCAKHSQIWPKQLCERIIHNI